MCVCKKKKKSSWNLKLLGKEIVFGQTKQGNISTVTSTNQHMSVQMSDCHLYNKKKKKKVKNKLQERAEVGDQRSEAPFI